MRIRKVYQGNLADNKIVNSESNSQTNTYSCDYINNALNECKEIVESGSNSNGNYIKYSDGTLICYARAAINTSINISYGSVYRTDVLSINLPNSFVDTNYRISMQGFAPIHCCYCVDDNKTVNSFSFIGVGFVSQGATSNRNIEYVAIGKWK